MHSHPHRARQVGILATATAMSLVALAAPSTAASPATPGLRGRPASVVADGSSTPTFLAPQAVTVAARSFGPLGAGDLMVATFGDPAGFTGFQSKLWRVPRGGGRPVLFADTIPDAPRRGYRGGLFLPAGFGSRAGQYATMGIRGVTAFDASGAPSLLADTTGTPVAGGFFRQRGLGQAAVAPGDFGAHGGAIIAPYLFGENFSSGGVMVVRQDGTSSRLASFEGLETPGAPGLFPIGAAFPPRGFGDVGGKVLVVDSEKSGRILAVGARGDVAPFTAVEVTGDQFGPRQMAFSGRDFGLLGGHLFVSVACCAEEIEEAQSPGTLLVVNGRGEVVAHLDQRSVPGLNPRDLAFVGGGRLLVGNDDRVVEVHPGNFVLRAAHPAAASRPRPRP